MPDQNYPAPPLTPVPEVGPPAAIPVSAIVDKVVRMIPFLLAMGLLAWLPGLEGHTRVLGIMGVLLAILHPTSASAAAEAILKARLGR